MVTEHKTVTIIGAGISGITTGIVLELLGYQTEIISKDRTDHPMNPNDPIFSSLFPSASVIPHSVYGEGILEYFSQSQTIFETLLKQNVDGLAMNQHYEIFEYKKDTPSYTSQMKNFKRINDYWHTGAGIPGYTSQKPIYGWVFDCFFADWPLYIPQLFEWYIRLGGKITIQHMQPGELEMIPSPVVNCSGMGSVHLFRDEVSKSVLKGHLLKVHKAPVIKNKFGQTISYNYNPKASIYSDAEGNLQDVYCYSRDDGWIIGGSRLEGIVSEDDDWTGVSSGADMIEIDGTEIPAPILKLNEKILQRSFGINLEDYTNRSVQVGYRYIRDYQDGLRLEKTKSGDQLIIHNYGHGGAGVTLSWGCALEVARLIREEHDPVKGTSFQKSLFNSLEDTLYQLL